MLDLQQSKYLDVQDVHRQGLGQLFLTVPTPKCIVTDYPEAARGAGGAVFVFVYLVALAPALSILTHAL
jgi:hypothetical protein